MHKVFINYRTGDGDEAAALLAQALSERFGAELVFRAAGSIPPGEPFAERLLDAARNSTVLLAIMGPDWSRYTQLLDDGDWVRREIVEAFAHGVRVIPVLKGRKTDRLTETDLPADLARLAEVQSLRLDTRDNGDDIRRIGDELVRLVPGLADLDRMSAPPAEEAAARNTTGDVRGTAVQGDDVRANFGTVVRDTQGTVHTGKGNVYNHSPRFPGDES